MLTHLIGLIAAIPFPDWISDEIFSIGPLSLKWYGLSYIVGWGLAFLTAVLTVKKHHLFTPQGETRGTIKVPGRTVLEDYAFWIMLGILLGGRIGSVILYQPEKYLNDPLAILRVWEGGMAFHGGLIGVCLAIFFFARRKGYEVFRMSDMAAIGAPLGLFLGRLANFVNQELWGHPTNVPWAFIFETDPLRLPRHPSQLYEAALEGLVLFAVLFILVRAFKILTRPGIASGVFIAGYGIARIIVEQFRVADVKYIDPVSGEAVYNLLFGMQRGVVYSLPMVIVGLAIILWALRRKPADPSFGADLSTQNMPAEA